MQRLGTDSEKAVKRIKVRLINGREEFYPYYVLDHFIKKRGITAFERSDGWVDIARDPIREKSTPPSRYPGPKKRFTDFLIKKRITDLLLH